MPLPIPSVRALAWFWGAVTLAGGAGALAMQALGPLPPATEINALATEATSAPPALATASNTTAGVAASPAARKTSTSAPTPKVATGVDRTRFFAGLPPLRKALSDKPHHVAAYAVRKAEPRLARHIPLPEPSRPSTSEWAEAQTAYWNYPTAQYATARLPRYGYAAPQYYGYYGGY